MTAYTTVKWSDSRDWQADNATVREAIDNSPYRDEFAAVVERFRYHASRHEHIAVCWWTAPFIYVQAIDDRKHYPCDGRAVVSFDLTRGTFADVESKLSNAFARKGWGAFTDRIAGRWVARYGECADQTRAGGCPPPPQTAGPADLFDCAEPTGDDPECE